ncbi:MAG: hypothetical protein ACPG5B_00940 [Chitinophagales bacterium]
MSFDKKTSTLIRIAAYIPFVYVASIIVFFVIVSFAEGHFPTYSNPDPKFYPNLYHFQLIIGFFVPIAFLFWLIILCLSFFYRNLLANSKYLWLGLVGFSLLAAIIIFDPMEIINWLAD